MRSSSEPIDLRTWRAHRCLAGAATAFVAASIVSRYQDAVASVVVAPTPPLRAPRGVPLPFDERTVADFDRQGHVVTRGLFSPSEFAELAAPLRSVAEAEEAAAAARKAEAMQIRGAQGKPLPFVQVFNPHKRHAAARRLAFAPVLAATAAALLGVASVRLYQDSLFWKRPGNDATAWHADLWTVPISTNHFVSMWLPLYRVGVGQSPLFYRTGTHHESAPETPDPEHLRLAGNPERAIGPDHVGEHHAPLEVGDATWHHGWTVHGAPPLAQGEEARLAYTAAFYSDETPILGDDLDALAARRWGASSIEVDCVGAGGTR
mmetsp:Transcript_89473/g.252031  ORF Transcript_89473/g.252031 Transcript_89473/m.252031 type:complete len:320 (+) Transcript_89473:132-1091(+)